MIASALKAKHPIAAARTPVTPRHPTPASVHPTPINAIAAPPTAIPSVAPIKVFIALSFDDSLGVSVSYDFEPLL